MTVKRAHGPRALAALLPRVAAPALRRRGFSAVEIVTNWAAIVGPVLAAETAPERLSFPPARPQPPRRGEGPRGARGGTLHVRAAGPIALEIQHLAPVIVERINICFGYPAVDRLVLIQGPVRRAAAPSRKPPAQPLNERRLREIESSTGAIGPGPLRDALRRLGRAVGTAAGRPE